MPIFHFNLNDHFLDPDEDGTELSSITEARLQAITFAGNYLGDNPDLLDNGANFRVEVTDHSGTRLFTVAIKMIDEQAA